MDKNSYRANGRLGATPNPAMPTPGPADEEFAAAADDVLAAATEVVRRTVPSHQAAIAIIVAGDWSTIRKYFSLSPKYEAWADYAVPARGLGIHSWLLQQHDVVRMDDAALAAHPAWAGFSGDRAHPPMRGWLAAPIRDRDGTAWGLVQLSDRADGGDYDQDDADTLRTFTGLLTITLQALWDLRNERLVARGEDSSAAQPPA